jgi:CubicO group peptidase (beta-lactamase class C family)
MNRLLTLAGLLFFSIPGGAAMNGLQQVVDNFKTSSDIPAFGASVVNGASIEVAASGLRRVESPTAVTTDDLWHIGSMTKSMTSTLVAILVQEGRLSWQTSLGEVFPDLNINKDLRELPITRFLTHTTGLDDDSIFQDASWATLNRLDFMKMAISKPLMNPQLELRYSNSGFMIVGAMLEKITGKSWEDLISEKVFGSLGMNSCGFGPTTTNSDLPPQQPWGHKRDTSGKIFPIVPGAHADNPPVLGPAGTVHCSLRDIAKFSQFELDQLSGRSTSLQLSPDVYKTLYQDLYKVNYVPGGLVIKSDSSWANGPLFWHNGSNTFNYSIMLIAPGLDKAIIATTNFGNLEEAGAAINNLIKEIRAN